MIHNLIRSTSRPMIDAAWSWAASHGLLRTNEIHKEQEAKLILSDSFELQDETGQEIALNGTIEAEDLFGIYIIII